MNLPYLPTDSLYKFCAFAGITLFVLSIYLTGSMVEGLEERSAELLIQVKLLEVELDHLEQDADFLDEKFRSEDAAEGTRGEGETRKDDSKSSLKTEGGKTPGEDPTERLRPLKGQSKERAALRQKLRAMQLKGVEAKAKREELDHVLDRVKVYFIFCIVALASGILLAFYGFTNWYRKIQVYQDAIIRRQAEQQDRQLADDSASRRGGDEVRDDTTQ